MSDNIREAFEKFLRTVDIGRDRSGFMPLTASEVKVIEYGFSGGWKAALAQQPAPVAVPVGWKLVPVVPTRAMIDAAMDSAAEDANYHEMLGRISAAWREMLAAAPAAPVAEQEPVAWMNPETGDAWSSKKKQTTLESCGTPGAKMAESYSAPLYTAPPAAEQPDTVAVPRAVLGDMAQDAEGFGAQLLANRLRALLEGGAE